MDFIWVKAAFQSDLGYFQVAPGSLHAYSLFLTQSPASQDPGLIGHSWIYGREVLWE